MMSFFLLREIIFVQLFFDNYCDNFLSHTHIMFLLFLSITFVFVSIPLFLCKSLVVSKVVIYMIVQMSNASNTHFSTLFLALILLFGGINVCLAILRGFNFKV